MVSDRPLVILGCGFTGAVAATLARAEGRLVVATTRSADSLDSLVSKGISAHVTPTLDAPALDRLGVEGADVLVTLPPDGRTDRAIAGALRAARSIVYLSTTGVFGAARGVINEQTPVDARTDKAQARLEAEEIYRELGATVLRCAGIYGPFRGLHTRVARGDYKIPGDGTNVVSRVHVRDLARLSLAALQRRPHDVFVVADACPVPQIEVIRWLCDELKSPLPPSVPIGEAPETLRHDRSIDARRVREALGVTLDLPSYREGFRACWAVERAT